MNRQLELFRIGVILVTLLVPTLVQSQEILSPEVAAQNHDSFESYWYQGLAELSRYQLSQSRYGEIHEGEAVLIFVTEDFDSVLQVKHDHGPTDDVVSVLKLNAYRRFYTGIYPYTHMTSTFSPALGAIERPLKVTGSLQEWCGARFDQLNLRDGVYSAETRSYFQSQGDVTTTVESTLLEDGLWSMIRRDPTALPIGSIRLIPSLFFIQTLHQPSEPVPAEATLDTLEISDFSDSPVQRYTIRYQNESARNLAIYFQPEFPHQILGWEETQISPFADTPSTTRAVLTNSLLLDYWSHHANADASYRDLLGLTQ